MQINLETSESGGQLQENFRDLVPGAYDSTLDDQNLNIEWTTSVGEDSTSGKDERRAVNEYPTSVIAQQLVVEAHTAQINVQKIEILRLQEECSRLHQLSLETNNSLLKAKEQSRERETHHQTELEHTKLTALVRDALLQELLAGQKEEISRLVLSLESLSIEKDSLLRDRSIQCQSLSKSRIEQEENRREYESMKAMYDELLIKTASLDWEKRVFPFFFSITSGVFRK